MSFIGRYTAKATTGGSDVRSSLSSISSTREGKSINKYGNKKVTIDGILFDSRHEAIRYQELKIMQRAGEISLLQRQVRYELVPEQREKSARVYTKGAKMGQPVPGRVIENPVYYVADFVYKDKDGNTVVEDAKGVKTKEYIIKRKLMLWRHGIRVQEV